MERRARPGDEPIRLFKSDFLESFSHISPVTVLAIWIPVTIFFLVESVIQIRHPGIPFYIVVALFAGWFVWTFTEYVLHRFLFHYHPKTEKLKKAFFLVHGVHHAQPLCKTRLVMPPVMSIPLSILFFGLFYLVIARLMGAPEWFYPVFAGFLAGYIIYDMMHYTLHHSKARNAFVQMCRYQHMQHHVTCPNMRFGVTFPFWDHVFGTMPKTVQRTGTAAKPGT